jgi:hypothetical protein
MKVCILALGVVAVFAQTPAPKSVIGEVTSADAGGLTVKTDAGSSYTVKLDDKTTYLRVPPGERDLKKAAKIALADIGTGDRVLARGPVSEQDKSVAASSVIVMTKSDLAQKHDRDRAEWQRRGVAGTVTALNPESKEITIALRGPAAKTLTIDAASAGFRRYAPDSVRFADAKPSAFTELKIGDSVRALGDKNEDGSRVKAEDVVSGAFRTLAGTVVSVDASAGELKLTDLQTKQIVTVRTNADTLARRLPPEMAAMMARRMQGGAASGGANAGEGAPPAARPAGARPPGGGGNFDLQQMLERMPALTLAELKAGDALIVSSASGADRSSLSAITLVAGVEPFLAAAPRSAGVVNLGSWNMDIGLPAQ